MQAYVVGFIFDTMLTHVLLATKARPAWQAGLLNGVGGHVEAGESPIDAMIRETKEETGLDTTPDDWKHVAHLEFPAGHVSFFYAADDALIWNAKTMDKTEPVHHFRVGDLHLLPVIRNLNYLIPLCIHHPAADSGSRLRLPVVFNEDAV